MEAYKAETAEIFRRFRAGEISRAECIIRLDVAFATLMPRLSKDQAETIRPTVSANNQAVIKKLTRWRREKFWLYGGLNLGRKHPRTRRVLPGTLPWPDAVPDARYR
jgi:hypothetical protein